MSWGAQKPHSLAKEVLLGELPHQNGIFKSYPKGLSTAAQMSPYRDTRLCSYDNSEQNEMLMARAQIHVKRQYCGHTHRKINVDHGAKTRVPQLDPQVLEAEIPS